MRTLVLAFLLVLPLSGCAVMEDALIWFLSPRETTEATDTPAPADGDEATDAEADDPKDDPEDAKSPAEEVIGLLPHPYDKWAGGLLALGVAEMGRRKLKRVMAEKKKKREAEGVIAS